MLPLLLLYNLKNVIMKNTAKIAASFILGLTILTTSCKKDTKTSPTEDTTTIPTTFNNTNAQALLNSLSTPAQTFTINASNFNTITCSNGAYIYIYQNAFLTQAGAPVTGNVRIEVKDVLTKKDMILNNATPTSNGKLLVSGGEVYFNATQNGQKLKMNPASAVYMNVPVTNPSFQMREFYATGGSDLSNSNLNWTTDTTSATTNTIGVVQDTIGGGGGSSYYYNFQCDSLNWSNCDYFYSLPGAKTTCTVNLTGTFNNTNTVVFLSMNGVNTLVRLNSAYSTISQEFQSYLNSLPEAVNYTIVAISFDGTNYYYGSQSVTMVTNMVINLPALSLSSKSQIEANLTSLP